MTFLESFYTEFVPIFLFLAMTAMGVSLRVEDLLAVAKKPKAALVGLFAQLVMLPALAIALGFLLQSPAIFAAGAIIVAACPGGVTSNAYTFASKADIALSISMTAIASAITIFSIPFLAQFALNMHLGRTETPSPPVLDMIRTLAQFTVVPVAAGMALRAWRPALAVRLIEPLRVITFISLLFVIVVGTATAWDTITSNLLDAGLLMFLLNATAMTLGFSLGRMLRLPFAQTASITFEVGVQNLSMALFVSLTFLKSTDLAAAALIYALFMKITALSFVWYVRRRLAAEAVGAAA